MTTRPSRPRRRRWVAVLVAVLLTLFVVVIALNFAGSEKHVRQSIAHQYSVHDSSFYRAMGIALGPSVVGGNHVETLLNGDETFPSMLAAIRGAQRTITFEMYVYWSGEIAHEFAQALAERARAGVRVHLLVDWVGSNKMDEGDIDLMQNAGIEFRMFRPLRWYNLTRFNNRTHRKLMVVDGRIGFTGGLGIATMWVGNAQDSDHWRDTHYRVEGPVVGQMQAAFLDNWIKATGEVLHGRDYFPELTPVGNMPAQVFISSPAGGGESMQLMYLLAIAAARSAIDIGNAYFIPDPLAEDALVAALGRGVKMRILLPGAKTDVEPVRPASRALWGRLLAAGAEIYEYQPTMYHSKVLIIDTLFVSVGSTNFDPRSFRLNDEANLNVYDSAFAVRQIADFNTDLKRARLVTYEEWRARPLRERILERIVSVFGALL